ncbi:hypothetical protein FBALC1_11852 [Flavobacteriales bacterium ALC-1]|nr:hypothetical protein FBALC1_11852 [Flavobacteriales bacterium ALC-1]
MKNNKFKIENRNSMSKKLYTLIFILFLSASAFAQRPDGEKIAALKVAHITKQLDLTKEEAQKFWPIYNANEEAENKLRAKSRKKRNEKKSKDLTESEAKALLIHMMDVEKERVALRTKMLNDLLEILPAKKIVALIQAESSFRRKMLDEYKKRQGGRRKN